MSDIVIKAALKGDIAVGETVTVKGWVRSKRDSIVCEVQKGRSVNETISLMRTIFG